MKSYEELMTHAKILNDKQNTASVKKAFGEMLRKYELEFNKPMLFTLGESKIDTVGVELEVGYALDIKMLPVMAKVFEKYKLLNMLPNTGQYTYTNGNPAPVRTFNIDSPSAVFRNSSAMISALPHPDGGGLESVLWPATLAAHQRVKDEYAFILKTYEFYGYSDQRSGAGIHLNIDLSLFGENLYQGLVNFYNMLFYYNDFFMYLCGRFRMDGTNSSARHQLSITDWLTDIASFADVFKSNKSSLKVLLNNGRQEWWFMNTSIFRDNRRCLEWRWFGSTLDINKFMAFIELGFVLPTYCASLSSEQLINLDNFIEYVTSNAQYPHLYEYILEMKEQYDMMQKPIANESSTGTRTATTV